MTIARVDEKNKPIPGTEEDIDCDALLLSVGLIPENELSKEVGIELSPATSGPKVNESLETNLPGVFACGNVLHVHDLVDYVSEEAAQTGKNAARYALGKLPEAGREISIVPGGAVRYTVPCAVDPGRMEEQALLRFRVGKNLRGALVRVMADGKELFRRKRPVMAPGEMEQVMLKREWLTGGEERIEVWAGEEKEVL